ncbi:ketose-bisphosphate aldolase [Oceanivirga salmonicida]|uniref:ketose-bisphosphate aldolase n=1 Tax=Oceanivirga salmonicida TaxID=1769291 RepID=UPI0012E25E47|nr:ketose-bisphosphate aldolase [Oceanivirga salmonicida]
MLQFIKSELNKAIKYRYAIPAVNYIDQETLKAYLITSKEENKPIIIAIAESHLAYIDFDEAFYLAKFYIKKYNTNAILHLDHGKDIKLIKKAIDLGFDSVMIDASDKSFKENVKLTKEIVDYAHKKNVFVESEIGHVGSANVVGISCSNDDNNKYTSVEEAVEFVKLTGTDSLAISIGTLHGNYVGQPKINFDRLVEIRKALDIPLVLHGGSSSGDENLNKCVKLGINKINIYTDFIVSAQKAVDSNLNYYDNKLKVRKAIQDTLKHYFRVFETKKIDKRPFFVVNPKSHLYGKDLIKLAKKADEVSDKYGVDIYFTAPFVELDTINNMRTNLKLTAQHMDSTDLGRGMGHIVGEMLIDKGVEAVIINHAEHKIKDNLELEKIIIKANKLNLKTIICASDYDEVEYISKLKPNIILCEPTNLIGTGKTSDREYIDKTTEIIRNIDKNILVMQAAGVTKPNDVYNIILGGADGTGCTSGIILNENPYEILEDMVKSLVKAYEKRGEK